jgi:hypothetical protein
MKNSFFPTSRISITKYLHPTVEVLLGTGLDMAGMKLLTLICKLITLDMTRVYGKDLLMMAACVGSPWT